MSSRYDPEIPGKIIAQMAIDPLKKTNSAVSGVSVGTRVTTQNPTIAPTRINPPCPQVSPSIALTRIQIDPTIKPKKRP